MVIDNATNDVITITNDRLKTTVKDLYERMFQNVKVINQDLWHSYRTAAYEAIGTDVTIIADPFMWYAKVRGHLTGKVVNT